jgi:hypothetical protein
VLIVCVYAWLLKHNNKLTTLIKAVGISFCAKQRIIICLLFRISVVVMVGSLLARKKVRLAVLSRNSLDFENTTTWPALSLGTTSNTESGKAQ